MASAPHDHQNQMTPPTRKGQQTRRRIVEAAAARMLTNGVGRTTLDEVIEAAGVGKSQMYHYFTGKDDLVEAVIAYQTAQVLSPEGPILLHSTVGRPGSSGVTPSYSCRPAQTVSVDAHWARSPAS